MHRFNSNHIYIFKKTIALAATIALYRLITTLTSFIGTAFLAKHSYQGLEASSLISSTQLLLMLLVISMLSSSSVVVSQAIGAKQSEMLAEIFQKSLVLATLLGIIVILLMLFIKPILLFLAQPVELVNITAGYFHIYIYAVLPTIWLACFVQFSMGIMDKKLVLGMNITNFIFFTVLSYLFIFGKFGIPVSGVNGLAAASVVQAWLSLLLVFGYFLCSHYNKKHKLTLLRTKQKSIFAKLMKVGFPIGLITVNDLLSLFVLVMMVGWLGRSFLAMQQISNQYMLLATIPIFGLAQACSILIANAYGAKRFFDVKAYGIVSLILGVAVITFFIVIAWLFAKYLILLFIAKQHDLSLSTLNMTSRLLLLVLAGQLLSVGKTIITGAYRGLCVTYWPLLINIFGFIISIMLAYSLGIYFNLGIFAINTGFICGSTIASILLFYQWRKFDMNSLIRIK